MATQKLPAAAKNLYIKLYCERKGSFTLKTKTVAAQSWLSLSPTKKRRFYNRVDKTNRKIELQYVINSDPYLPNKNTESNNDRNNISENINNSLNNQVLKHVECEKPDLNNIMNWDVSDIQSPTTDELNLTKAETLLTSIDDITQTLKEEISKEPNQSPIIRYNTTIDDKSSICTSLHDDLLPDSKIIEDQQPILDSTQLNSIQPAQDKPDEVDVELTDDNLVETGKEGNPQNVSSINIVKNDLIEPTPPCVLRPRDLYNMINKDENKKFMDLTHEEKLYYQRALKKIKNEYIRKYILYLENLDQIQLINHYRKKTECQENPDF